MKIGWITFWQYDPHDRKFLKWRKNRYDHFLDSVELLLERHVRVVPVTPHLVRALRGGILIILIDMMILIRIIICQGRP